MKKIGLLLLVLLLMGCSTITDKMIIGEKELMTEKELESEVNESYQFISGETAIEILATEDDYISKLSLFDYHSKFQSEDILDEEGRKKVYGQYVLEWSDQQKEAVDAAMKVIGNKMSGFDIDMPEINFILTSDEDEGGAAYTRGTSIILKPNHVYKHSESLEHLIAHEMFHVYSRTHKDQRVEMYGVIGYEPCEELVMPEALRDLKISNPDAPDNNFYITGRYQNTIYDFIPIIYSTAPYEIGSGASFFQTLRDDMLAVEIINGKPEPIYAEGELVIVKKQHIDDFYEKIGLNTEYTYHPEETMADNFVFMLYEMDVKSPWVLEGLRAVIDRNLE